MRLSTKRAYAYGCDLHVLIRTWYTRRYIALRLSLAPRRMFDAVYIPLYLSGKDGNK